MKLPQFLNALIDRYSYRSYLELGCDDTIFDDVDLADKTGVHPTYGGNYRGSVLMFFTTCNRKYDLILLNDVDVKEHFHTAILRLNDTGCLIINNCFEKLEDVVEVRQLEEVDSVTTHHGWMLVVKRPNGQVLTETGEPQREMLRIIDKMEWIEFLPPPNNPRNIWLSVQPNWGRIGHQFNDMVSGPILADIFGLGYHYTGFFVHWWGEELFNYYFNFADFFDKHSINEPHSEIFTPMEGKWHGLPFETARSYLRSIPSGTSVILKDSVFYGFKQLYESEQAGITLPGLYRKHLLLWASLIKRTNFYQSFKSDFEPTPGVLNVAVYVRGGGSIHDNENRHIAKHEYEAVLERIREDFPDKRLNVVYYTQGPVNDLVGNFVGDDVRICDQIFPRLYEVTKTMVDADVFVAGMSSFSTFISALRDKPSYYLRRIPFILRGKDVVV